MDSGQNDRGYDYLIYDSKGVRKVVDGIEYPATEDDLPKKHKDSGCKECTFADNRESLLLYSTPRELKEKAGREPVFVGKFTMPSWTGHLGFYIFVCPNCESLNVDYPHGYSMRLDCNTCGYRLAYSKKKHREIIQREFPGMNYEEEGFLKTLGNLLKLRFKS